MFLHYFADSFENVCLLQWVCVHCVCFTFLLTRGRFTRKNWIINIKVEILRTINLQTRKRSNCVLLLIFIICVLYSKIIDNMPNYRFYRAGFKLYWHFARKLDVANDFVQ